MANIVIFGTGDIARLAHHYFSHDSDHEVVAFTVDRQYLSGSQFCGLSLVDFARLPELYPPSEYHLFVAVSYSGVNKVRAEKYFEAKRLGYQMASYVSSRCSYLSASLPG